MFNGIGERVAGLHRVLGWGSLVELVANEWAQDIKKYQLPRILKGVGPMYHVTQLGKQDHRYLL